MKDELGSPAFALKAFGPVATVMPCLSRHRLAAAGLPRRGRFGEGASNPHQSGSHQIAPSRSDLYTASRPVAVKSVFIRVHPW